MVKDMTEYDEIEADGFDWPDDLITDRSFDVEQKSDDQTLREHTENALLQAMLLPPVSDEQLIARGKVTSYEIAGAMLQDADDRGDNLYRFLRVMASDDCLALGFGNTMMQLITITPKLIGGERYTHITCHDLSTDRMSNLYRMIFRSFAASLNLAAFPDSDLLDKYGVLRSGAGLREYIDDSHRRRPVFVGRRTRNFSRHDKRYVGDTLALMSGYGVTIENDKLHSELAAEDGTPIGSHKLDIYAVLPQGEITLLPYEFARAPGGVDLALAECPLLGDEWFDEDKLVRAGAIAKNWFPGPRIRNMAISESRRRELGREFEIRVREALESDVGRTDDPVIQAGSADEVEHLQPPAAHHEPAKNYTLSVLPSTIDEIGPWAEACFGNTMTILPRALKALRKSFHPDPERLAESLKVLATLRYRSFIGDRNAFGQMERSLKHLKMRDSFSNAERLKGRTGEDYLVQYDGRRMLLDRHFASNSSGFNDPRLVRIYYTFDRTLGKIIVGWMPTHLQTSKS